MNDRRTWKSPALLASLSLAALLSGCAATIQTGAAVDAPPMAVSNEYAGLPPPDDQANVAVGGEIAVDQPQEIVARTEPPELLYEEQTEAPGPELVWVPGYWYWSGGGWDWYYGRWAAPPEGRIYVAPYYERVGGNVVFVEGYWGPRDAVVVRNYGGDRIVLGAPYRPEGYRAGEHVRVAAQVGVAVGGRPGGGYARAAGEVRPMPTATAPIRTAARGPQVGGSMRGSYGGSASPSRGQYPSQSAWRGNEGRAASQAAPRPQQMNPPAPRPQTMQAPPARRAPPPPQAAPRPSGGGRSGGGRHR